MLGGTDYRRQREQDEKISKFKTINEVQALRGVFYNFFEMKDVQGKDATNDKVLISMQVAEQSMNPFWNLGEQVDEEGDKDRTFAYSVDLSGMFGHLRKGGNRRSSTSGDEFSTDFNADNDALAAYDLKERHEREIDLDIIEEQENDETGPLRKGDSCELSDELEDNVKKPHHTLERRFTNVTSFTV